MADQLISMQTNLDAYKANLQAQFTALELVVAKYKNLSNILNQQAAAPTTTSSTSSSGTMSTG